MAAMTSKFNFARSSIMLHNHRHTGLEIWGGRTRICPTRAKGAKPLGGSGGMLLRKILKNRVSLMPFPAF